MALRRVRERLKSLVARMVRPGLAGVETRLARIEERLGVLGAGAGSKYDEELAYWRWLIKTDEGRAWLKAPFEPTFGRWQRDRLRHLGKCIGAENDGALNEWCARQSAVEIGAGPYPALAAAPRWQRAVAVDPLAKGYAQEGLLASAAGHVVYIEATGESVPLPAGFADLVIVENALDHVTDPGAVVAEILRLLRPGGLLWVLVDLSEYRDEMHPHPFSKERVKAILAAFAVLREFVTDHHSHPKAYGEYRGLLRKPAGTDSGAHTPEITTTVGVGAPA